MMEKQREKEEWEDKQGRKDGKGKVTGMTLGRLTLVPFRTVIWHYVSGAFVCQGNRFMSIK